MSVTGAKTIAKNITKFGGGFTSHVNKVMTRISKVIDKEVTKNMSLTDHSLGDLAKLDHPYAGRHGKEGLSLHSPYWLVHKQSGNLLKSKEREVKKATILSGRLIAGAYVKLDEKKAKYAPNIIWGTSKMIPRPFLSLSLNNKKKEIAGILKKDLRDLVINFRGI